MRINIRKIGIAAASLALAGGLVAGSSLTASAADDDYGITQSDVKVPATTQAGKKITIKLDIDSTSKVVVSYAKSKGAKNFTKLDSFRADSKGKFKINKKGTYFLKIVVDGTTTFKKIKVKK
jgi:hypothetical protein